MPDVDDIGVVCAVPYFRTFEKPAPLESRVSDLPPIDPNTMNSDIVVPPDILEKQHLESDSWVIETNATGFGGGGFWGKCVNDLVGDHVASPGYDGGYGGEAGNWIDGSGSGRGSFGCRNSICRRATLGSTYNTIDSALNWLARHQESDGHWDTVKLGAQQKTDTSVTALALLAFTGAGHCERVGQYRDNVKLAVKWLIAHQQSSGLISDPTDAGSYRGGGYPHAIATLALSEAAGMSQVPATKAAAQRAVDHLTQWREQNEKESKLGWRYAPGQSGDLSVTGWCVMALKSAKIAGLKVDSESFEHALKFVESVEIKDADGGPSHFGYRPDAEHAETSHLLTAIATTVHQYCGAPHDATQQSVEWFVNKGGLPRWGAQGESVDLYYWYFGSVSTFLHGGKMFKTWREAIWKSLPQHQCKDGDHTGSWPVVGEYSDEWGRAGQTALSVLCLELYSGRYVRLEE
jgi:hypothetical protein